jgi:hypothetical protein
MKRILVLMTRVLLSIAMHAQAEALKPVEGSTASLSLAVPLETIKVVPSPEDVPARAKTRWERFEEALNSGPSRRYRVVEHVTNDGVRMACYEPCYNQCCVSSGGFSLTGGFGR